MCIHYDQPEGAPPPPERYRGQRSSCRGAGSWQSAQPNGYSSEGVRALDLISRVLQSKARFGQGCKRSI